MTKQENTPGGDAQDTNPPAGGTPDPYAESEANFAKMVRDTEARRQTDAERAEKIARETEERYRDYKPPDDTGASAEELKGERPDDEDEEDQEEEPEGPGHSEDPVIQKWYDELWAARQAELERADRIQREFEERQAREQDGKFEDELTHQPPTTDELPDEPVPPLISAEEIRPQIDAAVADGRLPLWVNVVADNQHRDTLRQQFAGSHDIAGAAEALCNEGSITYDQSGASDVGNLIFGAGFGKKTEVLESVQAVVRGSFYWADSLYATRMNCYDFVHMAGFFGNDEGAKPRLVAGTDSTIDSSTIEDWDGKSDIPRGKVVIGCVDGRVKRFFAPPDGKDGEFHYGISLGDAMVVSNHDDGSRIEKLTDVFGTGLFGYSRVKFGDYAGYKEQPKDSDSVVAADSKTKPSPITGEQLRSRIRLTALAAALVILMLVALAAFAFGGGNDKTDALAAASAAPTVAQPQVAAPQPTTTVQPAVAPQPSATPVPPTQAPVPTNTPQAVVAAPQPTAPPPPTNTPVPVVAAPPAIQTISISSRNVLRSYSATCSQAFISGNPPIGTELPGTGTWTFERTSPSQAKVTTSGNFAGTLDIPSRTLTMDRQDNAMSRRHKVIVWDQAFKNATGTTQLFITLGGVDCVMTFEENVTVPGQPWLP